MRKKEGCVNIHAVLVQVVARVEPIGEDVADHLGRQARPVRADEERGDGGEVLIRVLRKATGGDDRPEVGIIPCLFRWEVGARVEE